MFVVELLGQIIGFAIIVGVVFILIKTKGTHPENFKLDDNENIIEMTKGDYWEIEFVISKTRYMGEFAFTNKRLLFKQSFFGKVISIPYSDIVNIEKTFIMFFPVSFDVKTKDGKSYRFAMMKRQHFIDLINSLAISNKEE